VDLLLIPTMLIIVWQLASSRRRLRRTVLACALSGAESLGMTVVGAPEILGREPTTAPAAAGL
jgi:hypothetical protein